MRYIEVEVSGMRCIRCGNTDKSYFYQGKAGMYCRKCIGFGRAMMEEDHEGIQLDQVHEDTSEYCLQYPLTKYQKKASDECREYITKMDVLLECVCGAGKTEMVLGSISDALRCGKKVCFAIARRQVVLELAQRLKQYFRQAKIVAVCGGHTDELDGDLIVCTTHQLYRYHHCFSLLILDEPDAFPFRGDAVLHGIAMNACIGHIIYLTATPDDVLMKRVNDGLMRRIVLNRRPHGKDLPVPIIRIQPVWMMFMTLLYWLRKHACKPRIVFVPTIKQARILGNVLHMLMPCCVCTSTTDNRDEIIEQFKKDEHVVMVATTVLERGVTIPNVDICIWQANHSVFDEAGLIQMAGRAGRSFLSPSGDVLFLCNEKSKLVGICKDKIVQANRSCVA